LRNPFSCERRRRRRFLFRRPFRPVRGSSNRRSGCQSNHTRCRLLPCRRALSPREYRRGRRCAGYKRVRRGFRKSLFLRGKNSLFSGKRVGKRVRLISRTSASICAKSGFRVASSVASEVMPYFRSRPVSFLPSFGVLPVSEKPERP